MLIATERGIRRLRVGGGTDRSYSGNGIAILPVTPHAIALQNNGKLVVAGLEVVKDHSQTVTRLAVARLTEDGQLDSSFGNSGFFVLNGYSNADGGSISLRANRIIIGGDSNSNVDGLIVALKLDGTLDPTFANGGVLSLPKAGVAHDPAIAKDGSISAVLALQEGGARTVRVTSSGQLDTRYSADGLSPLVKFNYQSRFVDDDGSLIVVGWVGFTQTALTLARITSRGEIDRSFGESGYEKIASQNVPSASGIGIQSENGDRYIFGATGDTTADTGHLFVAKLTADDALDTSFGTDGFFTASPHSGDLVNSATFVPQGDKLVLAASAVTDASVTGFSAELIRVLLSIGKGAGSDKGAGVDSRTAPRRALDESAKPFGCGN